MSAARLPVWDSPCARAKVMGLEWANLRMDTCGQGRVGYLIIGFVPVPKSAKMHLQRSLNASPPNSDTHTRDHGSMYTSMPESWRILFSRTK